MKFAVHCAPSVSSCTPGWMVAVLAGAQVGAALAMLPVATAVAAATAAAAARSLRYGRVLRAIRRASSDQSPRYYHLTRQNGHGCGSHPNSLDPPSLMQWTAGSSGSRTSTASRAPSG